MSTADVERRRLCTKGDQNVASRRHRSRQATSARTSSRPSSIAATTSSRWCALASTADLDPRAEVVAGRHPRRRLRPDGMGRDSRRRRPPRVEGRLPAQLPGAHVAAVRALRPADVGLAERGVHADRRSGHDARGRLLGGCDRRRHADAPALAVRRSPRRRCDGRSRSHSRPTTSLAWARAYYIYGDDRRNESIFRSCWMPSTRAGRSSRSRRAATATTSSASRSSAVRSRPSPTADDVTGTVNCCIGRARLARRTRSRSSSRRTASPSPWSTARSPIDPTTRPGCGATPPIIRRSDAARDTAPAQ